MTTKKKYSTWSNQEKINHLNEVKAEYQENCDIVHKLTRKSATLLDEIAELNEEIIWD